MSQEFRRILDAAAEAKISFGSSTPHLFMKTFLDTVPIDIADSEDDLSVSMGRDWELSESLVGLDQSGGQLSLPDSFEELLTKQVRANYQLYSANSMLLNTRVHSSFKDFVKAKCQRCCNNLSESFFSKWCVITFNF
jgi:hypothetical protein